MYCHRLLSVGLGCHGHWGMDAKKAAYLDGWIHYHLLITGGFSGVFITWAEQCGVYVFIQGLLLHRWNCRGSAGVCQGVQRFLFQVCCWLLTIFISSVGIGVRCSQLGSALKSTCSLSERGCAWIEWILSYIHKKIIKIKIRPALRPMLNATWNDQQYQVRWRAQSHNTHFL